jgi:hypothetical protein
MLTIEIGHSYDAPAILYLRVLKEYKTMRGLRVYCSLKILKFAPNEGVYFCFDKTTTEIPFSACGTNKPELCRNQLNELTVASDSRLSTCESSLNIELDDTYRSTLDGLINIQYTARILHCDPRRN